MAVKNYGNNKPFALVMVCVAAKQGLVKMIKYYLMKQLLLTV